MMLARQNELIDLQAQLAESARRSALIMEQTAILDEIDEELDRLPGFDTMRIGVYETTLPRLSERLEGRIIALSKSLRPYRYLDGGRLIEQSQSPERGQLLLALLRSRIDIRDLLMEADFTAADLSGAKLSQFHLEIPVPSVFEDMPGPMFQLLSRANFRGARIDYSRLRSVDLTMAIFDESRIWQTDFGGSWIQDGSFKNAIIDYTTFRKTNLMRARFDGARLSNVSFSGTNLRGASFRNAKLFEVDFTADSLGTAANVNEHDLCEASHFHRVRFPPRLLVAMARLKHCAEKLRKSGLLPDEISERNRGEAVH
jgi:uncharacterized protein YjbI with pentapeptide repeats